MSFENKIITEKYIIKLNDLSHNSNNNYIKTKFKLIIKYMLSDTVMNNIPISDVCFSQIDNTNEIPFVIKTDLYSELSELDTLNQGNLLETIKKLKAEYSKELKSESSLRSSMNEGSIIERNQDLLNSFIQEFGYDPFQRTILNYTNNKHNKNNNDGIDINLSDIDSDNEQESEQTNDTELKSKSNNSNNNSINDKDIQELRDELQNKINQVEQNGSLESLNQIMDIIKLNFNDIVNDIQINTMIDYVSYDTNTVDTTETTEKPKKRLTKKEKEKLEREKVLAEAQAKEAETKESSKLDKNKKIIENLINKANELHKDRETLTSNIFKEGIQSLLTIADYYQNGFILIKSGVKANLLYIYLVKKFNDPDAMFNLGEALINGITIMKNHSQGSKLIKVAAEKFKHTKSIAKLKILTRLGKK